MRHTHTHTTILQPFIMRQSSDIFWDTVYTVA